MNIIKHDPLADVFYIIYNTEKVGHETCLVPASDLIKNVLIVMQRTGYIGGFEHIEDGRGGRIRIELIGKVNYAKIIKPRFSIGVKEFEKWESRYLPAKGVGVIILSTPKGIMTHLEAKEQRIGGRLLGYIY